jgi:protein-tyrosine phosphatase
MAAALLRHALAAEPAPLNQLRVASAGVAADKGGHASAGTQAALKPVGLDVSEHRSQPLTQALLDRSLAVLCMGMSHLNVVLASAKPVPERLHRFMELGGEPVDVPDPFGCDLAAYEATRDALVTAIPGIIEHLHLWSQ